jgi:hypothetical protein
LPDLGWFLAWLTVQPWGWGNLLLQNVSWLSADYMVLFLTTAETTSNHTRVRFFCNILTTVLSFYYLPQSLWTQFDARGIQLFQKISTDLYDTQSQCISEREIHSLSLGEDIKDDDLQLEADRFIGNARMSEWGKVLDFDTSAGEEATLKCGSRNQINEL